MVAKRMNIRTKSDAENTPTLRMEREKDVDIPVVYKEGYKRTKLAPRSLARTNHGNTKYDPVYYPYWVKKLALLGLSKRQIARVLSLSEKTFRTWFDNIKEIREAYEFGTFKADSMVAAAMFERAVGFSVPEEKVIVVNGNIVREVINKYYPPDVAAQEKWLSRRGGSSGLWAGNKGNSGNGNNKEGGNVTNNTQINISNFGIQNLSGIELGDFTDSELEVLISAGIKYKSIEEMKRFSQIDPTQDEDLPYKLIEAPMGRNEEELTAEHSFNEDEEDDEEWGNEDGDYEE